MSQRTIHLIHSNCDVYVETLSNNHVRIRFTEKDPELVNPTDFEIEGIPDHIATALSDTLFVLVHAKEFGEKGIS